jgi:hypothetical protein
LEEVRIVGTDEAPPTTPASPLTQIAGASGIRIGVQV